MYHSEEAAHEGDADHLVETGIDAEVAEQPAVLPEVLVVALRPERAAAGEVHQLAVGDGGGDDPGDGRGALDDPPVIVEARRPRVALRAGVCG